MKWNLSRVTLAREWDRNKQYYSWKEGIVAVPLPRCTPVQSLLAADSFLDSTSQCQGNSPRSWRQSCLLFAAQTFPLCRFSRVRHWSRQAESSTLTISANSTQASKESTLPTSLMPTIPVEKKIKIVQYAKFILRLSCPFANLSFNLCPGFYQLGFDFALFRLQVLPVNDCQCKTRL